VPRVLRGLLGLTYAYLHPPALTACLPSSLDLARAPRAKMLCPRPGLGPVLAPEGLPGSPCPALVCLLAGLQVFGAGMESCGVMPHAQPPSGRCKQLLNLPLVLYPPLSESLSLVSCLSLSPGQNTGVRSRSLLQGIFPTQGWNPGLPHCRQILYQLTHQGSPRMLQWVAYPFSSRS